MSDIVSKRISKQLLHLVFGGLLDGPADSEFKNSADWPHEGD